MAILLFILRLIGWVLLAVLVLVLIALFLPLGLQLSYQPDSLRVAARYGPLHFTLWPRSGTRAKPADKPAKPAAQSLPPAVSKTVEGDKASVTVRVEPEQPAARRAPQPTTAGTSAAPSAAAAPKPEQKEKEEKSTGGLPLGISARIDAAMQLLTDDPMAFARCMLGHTGWLGRPLLRAVRIRHLDIFWTAHTKEAASTAELYGAELALFNNLLAFAQQHISLQSDRLWLEPDFTGQRAGERTVSFELISCAAVLLWLVLRLLHRLWVDPQLKPAASQS